MKITKISSVFSVLAICTHLAQAQVTFNDFTSYDQNFTTGQNGVNASTMINSAGEYTWTDNSSVSGWYALQDDSTSTSYWASNGNGKSGDPDLFFFRMNGSSGALGTLRNTGNSGLTTFGLQVSNNTGSTIGNFSISYLGQQWQTNTGGADSLIFQYSTDATSLTTGNWTTVNSLTFDSLADSGDTDYVGLALTTGVLSETISGITPNVSLANGETMWFRWVDQDSSGVNQALSIDNLSITPMIPEASHFSLYLGLVALLALMRKRS